MRCRVLVLLLTGLLFGSVAKSDNSGTEDNARRRVQRLMEIQVGFEHMVPAGVSIESQEISRTGTSGKDLVVRYHVLMKGVPPDELFKYLEWPINAEQPSVGLEGISVGRDGILMCAGKAPEQCGDPQKPDDPINFITVPRKGEPTRLAFVSPHFKIGTVIVPDPIEARDKNCTLKALRLTPKFELAFLAGAGYRPNSDVHYRVRSERTDDLVIQSDAEGRIRVSVVPYPGGKSKTKGTVTVKITEPACSPEVSYDWGTI